MLEARKNRFVEKALAAYNRNLIRRRFAALKVLNADSIRRRDRSIPLIIYSNHSSWWDGAAAFAVWSTLEIDCFVMMEEKQLEKLRLFRRIGAFSVIRENARAAAKSIVYAANLLNEQPNRAVWLFPQGEILPNDTRPFRFFQGISRLAEQTSACLAVPAAMRFEFLGEFKPEAFVKIGEPELIKIENKRMRKKSTGHFENRLTQTLEELKRDIINSETEKYARIV